MTGRHREPLRSATLSGTIPLLAFGAVLAAGSAVAAEIRGSVSIQQDGLFGQRNHAAADVMVSVALFPAAGQSLPPIVAAEQEMQVAGSRIQPLYVALPRGSRLWFRNVDPAHHDLFTHSHTRPLNVRLAGNALDGSAAVAVRETGELHWFCRIHSKSYARVDVVDTPLVRMLRAGEPFEFRGLAPGKWRLRVAAPGAETVIVEAEALTAPPPLRIPLAVKGLLQETRNSVAPQPVAVEQLFPGQPGL